MFDTRVYDNGMGFTRKRRLDPDRFLEISLHGTATRRSCDGTLPSEAVAELKEIMGNRTDLAGLAAGGILGGYIAEPRTSHPATVYAAALLILAGADNSQIIPAFEQARKNASTPMHSNPPAHSTSMPEPG